jgi:hypothetical protein
MMLSLNYLIRIKEAWLGLLIDIWDGHLLVSASEMLMSDDEGAVSPTEISIIRSRMWVRLLIIADCTISVKKYLRPSQGSFRTNDTEPRQEMWHGHCLLRRPRVSP